VSEAAFYGALGSISLLLGALLTYVLHPSRQIIGYVMAFGAGTLISAVAYELVAEALRTGEGARVSLGIGLGAVAFFLGDLVIDGQGGDNRKSSSGEQAAGSPKAIVLGTLLDGIPESFILGLTIVIGGGVSLALLAAVFLSNLPEAMSATYGLDIIGWKRSVVVWMWVGVTLLAAGSAAVGYAVFESNPSLGGSFIQAFAAGALLTMLADTMMPEAFEFAGKAVGLLTVLGFCVAIGISSLD
jgi:zinc transporter, ZIP family